MTAVYKRAASKIEEITSWGRLQSQSTHKWWSLVKRHQCLGDKELL